MERWREVMGKEEKAETQRNIKEVEKSFSRSRFLSFPKSKAKCWARKGDRLSEVRERERRGKDRNE